MNQPEKADWQQRVLSEPELNQLLLTMSSLDAISLLQRQVELRAMASKSDSVIELSDVVGSKGVTEAKGVVTADGSTVGQSTDVAYDLNAIFAARAAAAGLVSSETESAPPATNAANPEPSEAAAAAPVETASVSQEVDRVDSPVGFVPTFANPVPPSFTSQTPSTRVSRPETNGALPTAMPVPSEFSAPAQAAIPVPVDDFKESIWLDEAAPELTSVEERITAESEVPDDFSVLEPISRLPVGDAPKVKPEHSGRRSAISLFTTWNGNGTLLLLTATGFLAAQTGVGLATLLAGVFGALFLSGFGFAAAALAARRGRLPQSVLARATFGVIGSNIPLAVVVIARIAATSLISIFSVYALQWFFPSVPALVSFAAGGTTYAIETLYLILFALLVVSGLVAFLAKQIYYSVAKVIAFILLAWSFGAVALGFWLKPAIYSFASPLSYSKAILVGTSLIIVLGLLWGTSASDETPDLKSTTLVPKLVATSLLNSTLIGSLAVVAGFAVFQMDLPAIHSLTSGVMFGVVLVFALANLIRRNTDAFRGFGLRRTPGWLFLLNILLVTASSIALAYRLGVGGAWTNSVGYLYFVGVPVLAWVTTFGMDSVLRRTDYHEVSLMRGYGFYGRFNWANLIGWLVATAIGWGFVQNNLPEFGWLGYFSKVLGLSGQANFGILGIWVAIGIGLIVPLLFTVPRIRDQEAEVMAIEARKNELNDVLGIAD